MARGLMNEGEFIEVFVDTPIELCESRDPKGLYRKARQHEIPNFTGISSPYEAPENPEVHIETATQSVEESVERLLAYLEMKGHLRS